MQQPKLWIAMLQVLLAMLILDSWQYCTHRMMHINKFMYKHVHSHHHRLVVPYAFGALYNHPVEALLDMVGCVSTLLVTGMTPRTAMFFFTIVTMKTVDDHCGLWLPYNPFRWIFSYNNLAYHDIHHQLHGAKFNFAQPFFVHWDKLLGTYMPFVVQKKIDGGFEVRPMKKFE